MNQNDETNYENQEELTNSQPQEKNKSTGQKLSESAVKGAATVAGGAIGGKAGAAIGSKAADVFNNSKLGNNVNDKIGNSIPPMAGLPNYNSRQSTPTSSNQSSPQNQSSNPNLQQDNDKPKQENQNFNSETNNQNLTSPSKKTYNNDITDNSRNNKNPSKNKYADTAKKHSKHADGLNDDFYNNEIEVEKNPSNKKELFPNKNKNLDYGEESRENEEEKNQGLFGNVLKLTAGLASGFLGTLGAVGAFIITHIVLISIILIIAAIAIFVSTVIALITSFFQYGKEDDGTVCYVTPSCNKVVIKSEAGDKTYSMDEYIAGAIVNYYEHDDYAVADTDVDQNLLKAFSVVIHSDIAAYSDYDFSSETCTVIDNSRFSNIYVPTTQNNDSNVSTDGSTEEDSSTSSDNKVDGVSGADAGQNTQVSEEQPTDEETKKKDDYYNKAKSAASSVITEVVDIYTQRIDIFYDGYKSILGTSSATGSDYKKIIRDYIEGSPDYEEVKSDNATDDTSSDATDTTDDNTKDDNDGEAIGIYPVCSYQKDSSNNNGNIGTIVMNNLCSQVSVTDEMVGSGYYHKENYSGIYSYDEFIAGVVANEVDTSWVNYPDILKAHAVAARTYLYNAVKVIKRYGRVEGDTCYITTSLSSMGFRPNPYSEITQAVQETSGEYIMVNGEISKEAEWDAFTYNSKDSENYYLKQKNLKVPIKWIESKISQGTINYNHTYNHGRGMSQWGAAYLAIEQGKNYKEIINFFYDADIGRTSNGYVMPINTFTMITGEKSIGYCKSRDVHTGTDFAAPAGTPVYAATSGVIEKEYSFAYQCYYKSDAHYSDCLKSNPNSGDNRAGQGFKIKNDDGTYSLYFHFSKKENLHVGDRVTAGQKIGEVGTTGLSSGNHLHYEMRLTSVGNSVDARNYLPMEGYSICYNNPSYKP